MLLDIIHTYLSRLILENPCVELQYYPCLRLHDRVRAYFPSFVASDVAYFLVRYLTCQKSPSSSLGVCHWKPLCGRGALSLFPLLMLSSYDPNMQTSSLDRGNAISPDVNQISRNKKRRRTLTGMFAKKAESPFGSPHIGSSASAKRKSISSPKASQQNCNFSAPIIFLYFLLIRIIL